MQKTDNITVVGGGLVGNVVAVNLAKKGYPVTIYERFQDARVKKLPKGKSINLGLTQRGMLPLDDDLKRKLIQQSVPMYGRYFHYLDGSNKIVPYGKNGEAIYSIKRQTMHHIFMNKVDQYPNITVKYNQKCIDVDLQNSTIKFLNLQTNKQSAVKSNVILGCDGHFSQVRLAMQTKTTTQNLSQIYIEHGYKEITIVPDQKGKSQLQLNYLHLWPRKNFLMTAFPNQDGSFTATLLIDKAGEQSLETLNNEESIIKFFKKYYSQLIPMMPKLVYELINHPLCNMGVIECDPWNYEDKVCLIGDSCHAMLPYLGLSMNCALEDCFYFDKYMDKFKGDWRNIFNHFSKTRKPNTDAITQMITSNYQQIRFLQNDPKFILSKRIDARIYQENKNYMPTYTIACFYPNYSFKDAYDLAKRRKIIFNLLCQIEDVFGKWETPQVKNLVKLIVGDQKIQEQLLMPKL